ncbi:MAG TPA: response regulator [Solirubrobacteraceae bacterium]|nr:response regulator [Solirubrobacteraceae bacterium]
MLIRRRPRILVVDDSAADVRLLREALREGEVQAEVDAAADGAEAIGRLRSGADRPDLILLDLNLPRVSGREVLEAVKTDPALASIPVIVLSTSASPADIAHCYAQHANAYLVKPLYLDEFGELVRALDLFWLRLAHLPDRSLV